MVFSSLIFIFLFLPLVIIATFVSGKKLRNLTLLLFSLFFYAWGEGIFILIMLASILFNYSLALIIEHKKNTHKARLYCGIAISTNLALLIFFKYTNFIAENIYHFLSPQINNLPVLAPIHLPIGISFFTFQAISYIVDVYRGDCLPQRNLINVGLYISLFPQLIAGPIVRFRDISKQLIIRTISINDTAYGIKRFIIGLAKKVLIANTLALTADRIFAIPPGKLPSFLAWLGALCYALQIFFDFSGYSDMAIGLGRIFGFTYLENFNYPYIAKSIHDFWQRWHISLSTWFRDYLYIPLGGNRRGTFRTYFNLFMVFFLCGLWHGASWCFIVWGLIHGLFIILEKLGLGEVLKRCWSPLRHIYTILVILISWVFFRAADLDAAISYISSMFGLLSGDSSRHNLLLYLNNESLLAIFFGFLLSTPLLRLLEEKYHKGDTKTALTLIELPLLFILLGAAVINLMAGVYNPFIYFRF